MKRTVTACLALLLSIMMTVTVWADAAGSRQPDYKTDYYMIVESPDGGINIYSTPSFEKAPLNSELIPNGTVLHIQGEAADANRVWGYTDFLGMRGYVALDYCRMFGTKEEAIQAELNAAGSENVHDVDYDVIAGAGNLQMFQGPGEKYDVVPGSTVIEKGTELHITKEANLLDGTHWGNTTVDGLEGWVNLERTEGWTEDLAKDNLLEMSSSEGATTEVAGQDAAGDAVNAEAEVAALVETTPEPTATSTPTPAPTATSTPTPEPTATSTPTPEPTATTAPTATAEPTATTEPTATAEPEADPTATTEPTEAAEQEDAEEAVETNGEVEEEKGTSPLLWIIGLSILVIIILLLYHLIKKH